MPLRGWMEERKRLFPGDPREWKAWTIFSCQDDGPALALAPAVKWMDETTREVLTMLGVELSGKEKGFGPEFEAIGGVFVLGKGPGSLGPSAATLLDFGADVAELKRCFEAGCLVGAEFYESFKGRYEWVGRLLVNGPARVCPAHRCWAQHWLLRGTGVKVSKALMESIIETEKDLLAKNFAPMVQDPLY